jgi:transcriptional regulator PpsR
LKNPLDQEITVSDLLPLLADMLVDVDLASQRILTVKVQGADLLKLNLQGWVGKTLIEICSPDTRSKLDRLWDVLEEADVDQHGSAQAPSTAQWRHLNLITPNAKNTAWMAQLIRSKEEGQALMVARDLSTVSAMQQRLVQAHQSMERDYLRLRHMEVRYRLLFETSNDPVTVLDVSTLKIVDANPAMVALFKRDVKKLIGSELTQYFEAEQKAEILRLFNTAQTSGRTSTGKARGAQSGQLFTLIVSMFMQEGGAQYLVRLVTEELIPLTALEGLQGLALEAIQKAPYGFAVTDRTGSLVSANEEFLQLVGIPSLSNAAGKSFEDWLARGAVDWGVLVNNLAQNRTIRNFATELVGPSGLSIDVEISALSLSSKANSSAASGSTQEQSSYGFFIRDVHRLNQNEPVASSSMAGSVSELAQLVGRMPMKDIVGETSDMIEKMCIQSALELTQNNRASAAEMLGLSRQSLYIKLHRYGLVDSAGESAAEA